MDLAVATFESGEKSSTIKLMFLSRRVLAAPALLLLDHPANQLKSLVLNSGISYHATIQKISLTLTFHWDAPVCLLNPSVQTPKSQLLKLVSPLCSLHNWWIRRIMSRKKFMGTLRQASQVSEVICSQLLVEKDHSLFSASGSQILDSWCQKKQTLHPVSCSTFLTQPHTQTVSSSSQVPHVWLTPGSFYTPNTCQVWGHFKVPISIHSQRAVGSKLWTEGDKSTI